MNRDLEIIAGVPIDIGIGKVYPLTLGEIVSMGEMTYNQYLSSLLLDKKSLNLSSLSTEELEQINKLSSYEIVALHCYGDEILKGIVSNALSTFLKEKVYFHPSGFFYIGELSDDRVISPGHFDQLKVIIQKQNFISTKNDGKDFKPADDNTAKIMEKMKMAKEKIQKQKKDDGLTLSDIVQIVSVYSNTIGILDIWKLTIYQLYMYYMRIVMWDEYHNNFILLPHVSDQKGLNLKHWSLKLNN